MEDWQKLIAMIKQIAKKKKITHLEIADKTNMARPQVTNFFNESHNPSLKSFIDVCKAVNVEISISDNDYKINYVCS